MNTWLLVCIYVVAAIAGILTFAWALGVVVIGDDQVGIVTKKFSSKSLPVGKMVALNGEAGVQADTLAPGWHFFFFPWQYSIEKVSMIVISEGEIALVIANDGNTVPDNRILGDRVDCSNFQDGKAFLSNGGKKGRQIAKLTTGTYRINTRLFTVISSANARKFDIDPAHLNVLTIDAENIGIVTIHDGASLKSGETAAPETSGHSSFQDEQSFISNNGFRGLQHEVILPGTWNINPWFATVEIVSMTIVPKAHVGVVISYVGPDGKDISGIDFKYGDIVENGNRGIWGKPLNPGKYPINKRTTQVELVPTSNFVLNWSEKTESHGLDNGLESIHMRSRDGFDFQLQIQQILHVPYEVAPKLIARFGNMANLVQNVLEPLIGNYFRNAGQNHDMLSFILTRTERQKAARDYVTEQLRQFNVEGVETMIGDLTAPESLMRTLQERKIAEESSATVQMQRDLAAQRQQLERENAIADQQRELVTSEQRVKISQQNAEASKREAEGAASVAIARAEGAATALKTSTAAEAESLEIRLTAEGKASHARAQNEALAIEALAKANASRIAQEGEAEAEVIRKKTDAIGQNNYAAIQVAEKLASGKLKLVPDIQFNGMSGSGSTPVESILSLLAINSLSSSVPKEPAQ